MMTEPPTDLPLNPDAPIAEESQTSEQSSGKSGLKRNLSFPSQVMLDNERSVRALRYGMFRAMLSIEFSLKFVPTDFIPGP